MGCAAHFRGIGHFDGIAESEAGKTQKNSAIQNELLTQTGGDGMIEKNIRR